MILQYSVIENVQRNPKFSNLRVFEPVVDPDLELRGEPGFVLLTLPAFLPSVIVFFTQGAGAPWPLP